jgi:protein-L-isoaspartate(D-aspartate) O-methyltransferase
LAGASRITGSGDAAASGVTGALAVGFGFGGGGAGGSGDVAQAVRRMHTKPAALARTIDGRSYIASGPYDRHLRNMTSRAVLILVPALVMTIASCRSTVTSSDPWYAEREAMVTEQLAGRGIRNPAVLAAMRRVPRHEFVPAGVRPAAYHDRPLPIGEDQTISQPYIVALMTEAAEVRKGARVLEVGTGSGYQAAVLAELGAEVYSIEIVEPLARRAAATLARLHYSVHLRTGDGYRGWPEAAPFDAVLVTAAPPAIPEPLKDQLGPAGRLVVPVGIDSQQLIVVRRAGGRFEESRIAPVRFVPMTGEAQRR